ncbi:MAG TPA: CoA transferase [Kofleriaceae bacterium]
MIGPLADSLHGVRVLDLSRLLPGPFLTMILADLGADVVKIEDPKLGDYLRGFPPQKGGMSGRFLAVNRGKRSCALDLKEPAQRDAFLTMVERADVIVESFRPGVLDKLGLGYAALSARNPGIVVCSISGFGQTGPYAHRAGHDLNYIALAGVLAMGGERDGAPMLPGAQIADLAGGALWSATGILAALLQKSRTGKGVHLDISMTEGALALLAAELGNADCGTKPTRGRDELNGGLAGYGVYATSDGRYLAVGALEPKFWLALNGALGRKQDVSEIIGDAASHAKTRAELGAIFLTKTGAEWMQILEKVDCCVELVVEPTDLAAHPLHAAREVFFTMDGGAAGPLRMPRSPLGAPKSPRPPPKLGEHTADVLAEYGVASGQNL